MMNHYAAINNHTNLASTPCFEKGKKKNGSTWGRRSV